MLAKCTQQNCSVSVKWPDMNGYTPKTHLPNYTNDFRECLNEDGDLVGIDSGKMGTYVICLALGHDNYSWTVRPESDPLV